MKSKQYLSKELETFVVYRHPLDFPTHYVLRRWFGTRMTEDIELAMSLEEVRSYLPPGRFRLDRFPEDDARVVEVWI
jgi:hypothetical protein